MKCSICKTTNQVFLIDKIHEVSKTYWAKECKERKWFCNKCKWGFDDNGEGNTI